MACMDSMKVEVERNEKDGKTQSVMNCIVLYFRLREAYAY